MNSAPKTKRKYFRKKVGMVFRIPLRDGTYGYGQVALDCINIFFDHRDKEGQWTPVEEILKKPMIFYMTVDRYVLKEGIWEILGMWPVDPKHQTFPDPFGWDMMTDRYTLWKTGVGQIYIEPHEIEGRELLASYGHIIVEQRLRDHFSETPNFWIERARNKLNPDFPKGWVAFYQQYGIDIEQLHKEYYGYDPDQS